MKMAQFSRPLGPLRLAWTIAYVLVAGLSFASTWEELGKSYPVWHQTVSYILYVPAAAGIVAGVHAATKVSKLFNPTSILSQPLGARSIFSIIVRVVLQVTSLSTFAGTIGLLPLFLLSLGSAAGLSVEPLLAIGSICAFNFFCSALGSWLGWLLRVAKTAFSGISIALAVIILLWLIVVLQDKLWFALILAEPGNVKFETFDSKTLTAIFITYLALGLFVLACLAPLTDPFKYVESLRIMMTLALPVGVLGVAALGIATLPKPEIVYPEEVCGEVSGIEVCIADYQVPRWEGLKLQVEGILGKYGDAPHPIQEIRSDELDPFVEGDGVLTLSLNRDGSNAEMLFIADVLSGSLACAEDTPDFHFATARELSTWLKEVDLPPDLRPQVDIVSDDTENRGPFIPEQQENDYPRIFKSDPETFTVMHEFIRNHWQEIEQCLAPQLPEGVYANR